MTNPLMKLTEGWTGEFGPFTLRIDVGDGRGLVPLGLQGLEIYPVIRDFNGRLVQPGGTLRKGANDSGQVYYTPDVADFPVSGRGAHIYTIRFKVVDTTGAIVFFPDGEAAELMVFPQ